MSGESEGTHELPPGWTWVTLGDLAEVLDSRRIPLNQAERDARCATKEAHELFPYYGATGQVGWVDEYLFEDEAVLLGEDGAPFLDRGKEKAYLVSGKYWVNNHAHILRARVPNLNAFLRHQLNFIDYSKYVSGTTRLKLTQAQMVKIPIVLPPQREATRIADRIDDLFGEIEAGEQELEKAREGLAAYRRAVLRAAVTGVLTRDWRQENSTKRRNLPETWVATAFDAMFEVIPDKGRKLKERDYRQTGLFPVVDQGEKPIAGYTDDEGLRYVGRLPVILFGDHTRRFKYVDYDFVVGADGIKILAPHPQIEPLFGFWALRSAKFENRGYSRHFQFVRRLVLPVPPIKEQRVIAERLQAYDESFDDAEATVTSGLMACKRLRQSILARAFSGNLAGQDAADEAVATLLARLNYVRSEQSVRLNDERVIRDGRTARRRTRNFSRSAQRDER